MGSPISRTWALLTTPSKRRICTNVCPHACPPLKSKPSLRAAWAPGESDFSSHSQPRCCNVSRAIEAHGPWSHIQRMESAAWDSRYSTPQSGGQAGQSPSCMLSSMEPCCADRHGPLALPHRMPWTAPKKFRSLLTPTAGQRAPPSYPALWVIRAPYPLPCAVSFFIKEDCWRSPPSRTLVATRALACGDTRKFQVLHGHLPLVLTPSTCSAPSHCWVAN